MAQKHYQYPNARRKIIDSAEIKIVRWMRGFARKDRVENESVRKELRVEKVSEKRREKRLRWFGRVGRS